MPSILVHKRTFLLRCRAIFSEDWPRLVVGLISLYGICFATALIHILTKTFDVRRQSSDTIIEPTSFAVGLLPQFHDSIKGVRLASSTASTSTTVATAVYILAVLSSLSVIDSIVGLMVVTRRSLRLTQIALAIWCLRFLFRTISLISTMYMLALHSDIRTSQQETVELNDNASIGIGAPDLRLEGSILAVQSLDVIIGIIHGWSLVMLIRDRQNQPRIHFHWTFCCRRPTKAGAISVDSSESLLPSESSSRLQGSLLPMTDMVPADMSPRNKELFELFNFQLDQHKS